MPDSDAPDDDRSGGRFSYESALWHTERQNDRVREIRARLGVAISVNSLIIGLFALALAAWVPEPGAAIRALSVIILVIFTIGIIGTFAALREDLSSPDADPRAIRQTERRFGEAAARDLATRAMLNAYDANEPLIARMEHWLQVALTAMVANAILAPATIIAAILS